MFYAIILLAMFFGLFGKNRYTEPQKLCFTTDIHCHILPGIDDGAKDTAVSVSLVETMQQWGIKNIIATPHVTEETFENTPQTIAAAYGELGKALSENGMDIPVSYSAEYRMDGKFGEILKNDGYILMPGRHLLIENSFVQPAFDLKNIIFELQLKDIRPVLAHPERYSYYQRKRKVYTELIEAGCEFQINILSLSGYYGEAEKETALWLIDRGYVSFLGTDLHHFGHIESINRFLCTKEYSDIADRLAPVLKNDTLAVL